MTELVAVAKAFADPNRIRIISALRNGELCVCELSDALGVTQSTLSTHLQVIREAELVQTRKQGKWVYYRIKPEAEQLIDSIFGSFARELKADETLRRDAKGLTARLKERQDGECCVGFCRPKSRTKA